MKMIWQFVLFFSFCLVGVFDAEAHEVSVMIGDSLTLDYNASEMELKNEIEWRFNDIRIAYVIMGNPTYDDYARFKVRLKLDRNGSLTIKDTRINDTGVYKLSTIINNRESIKLFRVTVHAPLSIPVITSDISHCALDSKCSLLCSVVNVSHVTLSWYKENCLLSRIDVPDLRNSLSLPLEVEYQDKNTYSCVLSNPISNQTKHVCITDLCRLCSVSSSDEVHYGGGTEAAIRLVVTALVGLAAVAAFIVLVYDIRCRRVEHETQQ